MSWSSQPPRSAQWEHLVSLQSKLFLGVGVQEGVDA